MGLYRRAECTSEALENTIVHPLDFEETAFVIPSENCLRPEARKVHTVVLHMQLHMQNSQQLSGAIFFVLRRKAPVPALIASLAA